MKCVEPFHHQHDYCWPRNVLNATPTFWQITLIKHLYRPSRSNMSNRWSFSMKTSAFFPPMVWPPLKNKEGARSRSVLVSRKSQQEHDGDRTAKHQSLHQALHNSLCLSWLCRFKSWLYSSAERDVLPPHFSKDVNVSSIWAGLTPHYGTDGCRKLCRLLWAFCLASMCHTNCNVQQWTWTWKHVYTVVHHDWGEWLNMLRQGNVCKRCHNYSHIWGRCGSEVEWVFH